ncbi:MAG: hypothetical protein JWQ09_3513 [Segetibacter sp.]|nr:hypothetical protein [Segetibacter sp.]
MEKNILVAGICNHIQHRCVTPLYLKSLFGIFSELSGIEIGGRCATPQRCGTSLWTALCKEKSKDKYPGKPNDE